MRGVGVLNQGSCGSCFSFSAATLVSYRNTIGGFSTSTNGIASPQSIIDCGAGVVYTSGQPCGGGVPYYAIQMAQKGLGTCDSADGVDGDGKACNSGCLPYCASSCGARSTTCRNKCPSGGVGSLIYTTAPYKVSNSTNNPNGIKKELMTNGPLVTIFDVFKSWQTFTSNAKTQPAVFDASNLDTSVYIGGHAVVMVGWGNDPIKGDYWILQNSWGDSWGDSGFFYVKAGLNLINIESELYGTRFSASPTGTKRELSKRDDGLTQATIPSPSSSTGVPVSLDPAALETQLLGKVVAQQFAATSTSLSGFEFASMQSATAQVIAGSSYQVTVAGADGTLVSATVITSSAIDAEPEFLDMNVVGKVNSISNGPAATAGNPSSLKSGGGQNGGRGGGDGGGGGNAGEAVATGGGGLSGGAIAGAVVGSVMGAAVLVGVAAGAGYAIYQHKKRSKEDDNQNMERSTAKKFDASAGDLSPRVDNNTRPSITTHNPNVVNV